MTLTPTPEQLTVLDAAKGTDNLLITARAGAAKTSTLVMVAEALPTTSTLCLAFNKRIATEMQERLPPNCVAMTLNALGHRAWSKTIGRPLRLETGKNYNILKGLIENLRSKTDKEEAYDSLSDILDAVAWGKSMGWIPHGHFDAAKRLVSDEDFFFSLDEDLTALVERLVRDVTLESIARGLKGEIDFNDQLLLPTVFSSTFPQYPLVMVDEAQDLSLLNHSMLRKIARKRLIAVGDDCQSIYAFRGAHVDSMSVLRQTFDMKELTLSISFRCPIRVVREAQWRAPNMQWPEWAIEGEVAALPEWSTETLPDGAAILCRNNAPLFSTAIKLLKDGRYPEIVGNDIGKGLLKVLKKLGPTTLLQEDVLNEIDKWETVKLTKSRAIGKVKDQAECLRIFARQGPRLSDAIAYAEHIMSVKGPIQLMTIHKSKGLEFDNVFLLDRGLIQIEYEEQERNLLYVAQTRAKRSLFYIASEAYTAPLRQEHTSTVP